MRNTLPKYQREKIAEATKIALISQIYHVQRMFFTD